MSAEPAAPWRQAVLHEDKSIRIDHFRAPAGTRVLVITFDPLLYLADKPHFGQDFLRKLSVDIIAVRKKSEDFYQSLPRDTFLSVVQPVLGQYGRVVAYGSSLGAYAALYFCRDIDCEIVASSPRVSAHPHYGAKVWQRKVDFRHEPFDTLSPTHCRPIVIFDPKEPLDRRYIEGEVLPQFPQALVMRVPYSGHPSNHFLAEIGFIAPFMRAVIVGAAHPLLDRRQRVRSGTYYQVLADLCVKRRKLRWADVLIERSLALNMKSMLAHRTLGQLRMQQDRGLEAIAALEAALGLSPQDPLTLSLLDRARERHASHSAKVAATPPRSRPGLRQVVGRLRAWWGLR